MCELYFATFASKIFVMSVFVLWKDLFTYLMKALFGVKDGTPGDGAECSA